MNFYFFDSLNNLLDIFYPQACVVCGKYEKNHSEWICQKCARRIIKYKKEKYDEAIVPIIYEKSNSGMQVKKYFDGLLFIYEYKSIIRKIILNYKFRDSSYISHFFVSEILNSKKFNEILTRYDIIISVPIDKMRERVRGYNQTAIILKELNKIINSEKAGIKISTDNLIKIKKTQRQSLLTGIEREKNVKDAFNLVRPKEIIGKNIIVFDDIYTTGSTINEISKLLKSNGARKVLAFTLAKDWF